MHGPGVLVLPLLLVPVLGLPVGRELRRGQFRRRTLGCAFPTAAEPHEHVASHLRRTGEGDFAFSILVFDGARVTAVPRHRRAHRHRSTMCRTLFDASAGPLSLPDPLSHLSRPSTNRSRPANGELPSFTRWVTPNPSTRAPPPRRRRTRPGGPWGAARRGSRSLPLEQLLPLAPAAQRRRPASGAARHAERRRSRPRTARPGGHRRTGRAHPPHAARSRSATAAAHAAQDPGPLEPLPLVRRQPAGQVRPDRFEHVGRLGRGMRSGGVHDVLGCVCVGGVGANLVFALACSRRGEPCVHPSRVGKPRRAKTSFAPTGVRPTPARANTRFAPTSSRAASGPSAVQEAAEGAVGQAELAADGLVVGAGEIPQHDRLAVLLRQGSRGFAEHRAAAARRGRRPRPGADRLIGGEPRGEHSLASPARRGAVRVTRP